MVRAFEQHQPKISIFSISLQFSLLAMLPLRFTYDGAAVPDLRLCKQFHLRLLMHVYRPDCPVRSGPGLKAVLICHTTAEKACT